MAVQKFLMLVIFVFLALRAESQETLPDVTGSGDGHGGPSTYSVVPLIDDDGDIATNAAKTDVGKNPHEAEDISANTTILDAMESSDNKTSPGTTVPGSSPTASIDVTAVHSTQTETPTTQPPITDPPRSDSVTEVVFETTESVTPTIYSASEMITDADVTTEEASSTTDVPTEAVKFTTKETTTTVLGTTVEFKASVKDTAVKDPAAAVPASTLPIFKNTEKRCMFLDAGLQCNTELVCYGEGEIDCTEDDEMDFDETNLTDLSSASEDSDYIAEGKTSEIAPVKTTSSRHRHVIYIPELIMSRITTPTDLEDNSTAPAGEELLSEGVSLDDVNVATEAGVINIADAEPEKLGTFSPFTESSTDTDDVLSTYFPEVQDKNDSVSTVNLGNFSEELAYDTESATDSGIIDDENTTVSLPPSEEMNSSLVFEEAPATTGAEPVLLRSKRDKKANASDGQHMSNYKVSELGSSKKNKKVCRLVGNIFCSSDLNTSMCTGKTFCQVPHRASQAREKPGTPKALEIWTIVVIIVCVIIAVFTISLLLYIIITSYKKSKVQPHDDVTTLNYVNSSQP